MALQKADIQRFEWLTQMVERLGIRFPVAEISEKTGFDQGNISSYLKGKKPISDNFITKFREAYKVAGPGADQEFTPMQLFAMFLKMAEKQDGILESQLAILQNIQSKMAQESTQAAINNKVTKLDDRLNEALAGIETIVDQADELLMRIPEKVAREAPDKKDASKDAGRIPGGNDGGVHKRGRSNEGRR